MILILMAIACAAAASTDEAVLGYINHIPPEPHDAAVQRHATVAALRSGIPVLVHRGVRTEAPENTLEAYAAAMDLGADGVEIDIRRTTDGVLYLFHDDTLDRMTKGSGKAKEISYYELLRLTPKNVFGRATAETRVPTLAAFLVLARQRAMLLHLDVKEPGLQEAIARMFDQADMWDHVVEVNGGNADRLRPPPEGQPRDPAAPYNKVGMLYYKGWAPKWEGPEDEIVEAIRKWLPTESGREMVFCEDPRHTVKAMGRKVGEPAPLPAGIRAWWGPEGIMDTLGHK
jgi:hypothetical protein